MAGRTAPSLIAIVDDEESVRVALGRLCRAYGLETREYRSAHELVASLADRRPDCVILDLQLPDCEGLDADEWLRRHGVELPVVIITGRDDAKLASEHVVLTKPVDATTLLAAIENVVRRRSPAR
jgi:FixJ family two-component response regulator